ARAPLARTRAHRSTEARGAGSRRLSFRARRPRPCGRQAERSLARARGTAFLELFQGLRPVAAKEAGERAIGEQAPAGLASSAVVGLVLSVGDALDRRAAHAARLSVAPMDVHLRAEGRHLLRKPLTRLLPQACEPFGEHGARRLIEA